MGLLELKDFSLSFGDKVIFQNANFIVNKGDKMGVVGVNGAGKSTLLHNIREELKKDNIPVFNFITNKSISDEYMKEAYNIIGRNLNSFVTEPVNNIEIDNIMENYKEYKTN